MSNTIAKIIRPVKINESHRRIIQEKYTITPGDIDRFKSMKASYKNFPRLPKFILQDEKFKSK